MVCLALLAHAALVLGLETWLRHRAPVMLAVAPGRATAHDTWILELDPNDAEEMVEPNREMAVSPELATDAPIEPAPVAEEAMVDAPTPFPEPEIKPAVRPSSRPPTPTKSNPATANSMAQAAKPKPSASGSREPRTEAGVVSSPLPYYPPAARSADFQGVVRVRVSVDTNGRPVRVELTRSSGRADCDQSARETVQRSWRFRPATLEGRPVESVVVVAVRFSLDS